MIHLPPHAVIILQDEAPEKMERKPGTLILSPDELDAKPLKPNTGVVKFACAEFEKFLGDKVTFRFQYGDIVNIEGVEYVYLRDFNSSIFYVESN